MKLRVIVLLCLVLIALPDVSQAEITSVLMYPSQCRVTQHLRLQAQTQGQRHQITFDLPGQVDPDTLVVNVETPSISLENISWKRMNRVDEQRVAQLRQQLENAKSKQANIVAKINAINAGITFWTQRDIGEVKSVTAEELLQIATTLNREVESLFVSLHPLEMQQKEVDREVDLLQSQLDEAAGNSHTMWHVSVDLGGSVTGPVDVKLVSVSSDCVWSPVYRFNAVPEKDYVDFTFEAQINQGLGVDIENADISLATLAPRQGLNPPSVSPWIIEPRLNVMARRAKVMSPAPMADMAQEAMQENFVAGAAAPQEERRGASYSVWHVGKRTISAGESTQLLIFNKKVKSEFVYTVRPSADETAFLTAKAEFEDSMLLPQGQAIFLVDGALVGKRQFEVANPKVDLFFGKAPLVEVKNQLASKQSGDAGFLTSKQTYTWQFVYTITNNAQHPVNVVVEEAMPQVRDENIKVTTEAQPKAEIDADDPHLFVWKVNLSPAKKQTITYTVALEAPKDMELNLGWR